MHLMMLACIILVEIAALTFLAITALLDFFLDNQ